MPAVAVGEVLELLRAQGEKVRALRTEVQELRAQLVLPAPAERRGWWPWGRKARKGVVEQDIG